MINDYDIIINSQLSDHFTICLNLNYEKINIETKKDKGNLYHSEIAEYNFNDADEEDWLRLSLELDKVNWTSILEDQTPNQMIKKFLDTVLCKISLIFRKLPQYDASLDQKAGNKFSSKNKIPKKVRILMRNKSKLSKAIQRTKSQHRYLQLSDRLAGIENELKDSYNQRRQNQEKEALLQMKKNPKAFFKYAKKFSKSTSGVGPFLNDTGDVVTDGENLVDILRRQYESVYSQPMENKKVSNPQEFFSINNAAEQLDYVVFDREDIVSAIDQLSTGSSAGPDGVPAILLKKCKRSLSEPLHILFQSFLTNGTIPSILKEAFVIPWRKCRQYLLGFLKSF